MRDFLEYFLVKSFLSLTKILPNNATYALCKNVALLFFKFEKRRRNLTLKNLQLIYPQMSENEVLALAQKIYENVAITIAEILLMMTDKLDMDAMVENGEEAIEEVKKYSSSAKNGIIMLTAHFSNWELLAHYVAYKGFPLKVVGRRGNNTYIEERLTTPFREKFGNQNLYKELAATGMIRALRNKETVGLLIDQKSGGPSSIPVRFFDHPADTTNSIAILKLKYNPLVLPMFAIRQPNGHYRILTLEPIEYIAQEEENQTERIAKMTQFYNDIMEEVIRAYPEQWFWMHNRWRIRP